MLTGARLSEALNLRWEEIGELSDDGASARLEDSKTGARTLWLRPQASWLFPPNLTSDRLYTFWFGVREEAGLLPGIRIHDERHTWASQTAAVIARAMGYRPSRRPCRTRRQTRMRRPSPGFSRTRRAGSAGRGRGRRCGSGPPTGDQPRRNRSAVARISHGIRSWR